MSKEVSVLEGIEGVEQVAAELPQETSSNGPLSEKEMLELITGLKGMEVKDETPQHAVAIASVKKGLIEKAASISALMNCDDFIPSLISALQSKAVEVQLDVMSIVDLILKDGDIPEAEVIIGSGMIPALVTLLTSKEDAIYHQALGILRSIALLYRDSSRSHFRNSVSIPTLIKLAEETENTDRLDSIAMIAEQVSPHLKFYRNDFTLSAVHGLVKLYGILRIKKLTYVIASGVPNGFGEVKYDLIEALIETGEVLKLVKCLEDEVELEAQVVALYTIMDLVNLMRKEENVTAILYAGLVPLLLELLKNSDVRLRAMVPIILHILMYHRPTFVRDEIVRLGGLQQIVGMLKNEEDDFLRVRGFMTVLVHIFHLETTPKLPLELFEGLPEALKLVLADKARYNSQGPEEAAQMISHVFVCVAKLVEYGDSGIDLIMRAGLYEVFVGAFSSSQNEELVFHSFMAVTFVSGIKQEYWEYMMKLRVLDSFPRHLQNPSDNLRLLVICFISFSVDESLTPEQTKAILEMKPLIQAEEMKGLELTKNTASVVLSKIKNKLEKKACRSA